MEDIKITVIIPVYNVENYLKKCLDTIINQTYKNLEIIIIDDGSTDKSSEIVDEYAVKDSRIKVFHQNNLGVSVARNKGLDNANGDYILFVDPDDWIELNTCEILLNEILHKKVDLLIFNFYREFKNNTKKNPEYSFSGKREELKLKIQESILAPYTKIENINAIIGGFPWNKFVSRKAIGKIRFPLENLKAIWEDFLFNVMLLDKSISVDLSNNYLYHYRTCNNSATRRFNSDIIKINDEFYEILSKLNIYKNNDTFFKQFIYVRLVNNLKLELDLYFFNKELDIKFKEKIKLLERQVNKNYLKEAITKVKLKNLKWNLRIYTVLLKLKLFRILYIVNKCELFIKNKLRGREI